VTISNATNSLALNTQHHHQLCNSCLFMDSNHNRTSSADGRMVMKK